MAVPTINLAEMKPLEQFSGIANVTPNIRGTPAESDWRNDLFHLVPIWTVGVLDNNQRALIGSEWYNDVRFGRISLQTVIKGLKLALSLKSLKHNTQDSIIFQQPRDLVPQENHLRRVNLPEITAFNATSYTLRGANAGANPIRVLAVQEGNTLAHLGDSQAIATSAYCFLATYMMRLLIKAPEHIQSGLNNMRTKFESFYGRSFLITGFNPSNAIAAAYRVALQSQTKLALTYSHAIAYTHQNRTAELHPNEVGLLSYACFLQFAYTGMHAYTLMMELQEISKVPLSKLLSLFYCNITAPALNKIELIVRTYERTTAHPDRDVTFRYCTHWGPQYFSSLRSRNCTCLLFTISCAWKILASTHERANPEKIVATSNLSDQMKNTLRRAGEIIGRTLSTARDENRVGEALTYSDFDMPRRI